MTILTYRQALCGPLRDPAGAVAALRSEGWRARADVEPWPLELPVDWAADPFEDRNWRFQLNAWRPLSILITAHGRLKDDALLDDLVALMLDWARHEAERPDDPLLWNDMGTGLRAAKLAYVLTQPGLADSRFDDVRGRLASLGQRHLARLRDRDFIGQSNHGLFQVHGAMALCRALPHAPEAAGAEGYVEEVFADLLHQQFGQECVHLEHSPGYHLFALKTIDRFARSGWYDSMPEVQRVIREARRLLPWFVLPDGRLSGVGDSSRLPVKVKGKARTPAATQGRLFREAGYAVIRNGSKAMLEKSSMLLVTGGHHSNVHKHADDLSFELFAHGRPVIVDTGKYSYSRARWRAYTDSAAAHNAIDLVEERADNGVRRTPPAGGLLTHLEALDWGWMVRGRLEREGFGVAHARTFLYRPHRWLVLLDRVACRESRRFTAWLHLAPDLQAERAAEGLGWTFPDGRIRYVTSGEATLQRRRGELEPDIQGWAATAYHERTPNDALGLTMAGTAARLATIISLKDYAAPSVEITPDGFVVRHGDALIFKGDAEPGNA